MKEPEIKRRSLMGIALFLLIMLAIMALFFGLPMFALLYFQEQIKQAQGYGYLGVFFIGLLCGITVIPAPTQVLVFTFGRVLNPWLVGLVAGTASAIGGITVYLTGTGVQSIWSRLRSRQLGLERKLSSSAGVELAQSRAWIMGRALYDRLTEWISGRKGGWALFLTSAIIISPFYPAGLAAGSMGMGLRRFFLISWAGRIVRYTYVALAGWAGLELISNLLQ